MSYTYNETKAELIENGDYECILEKVEKRTTASGKEYLNLQLRLRTDVEQKYGNRIVFDSIWQEREHQEYYNRKRINMILGTQHFKDGTVFEDIDDVIKAMEGIYLVAHIVQEFNEFSNKDINKISYYKSSKNGTKTIEEPKQDTTLEAVADDLPF